MSPRKMQSSDRNTMITRAERPMNHLYFWAIQDVNANRTAQKNVILTIKVKAPFRIFGLLWWILKFLTYWQCKNIRKSPGAVEHYVKLWSTNQTEQPCDRGAKLPPNLPLHVPECPNDTESKKGSDCTEDKNRLETTLITTFSVDMRVRIIASGRDYRGLPVSCV